jgi:hypothetical protein
MAEAKKSSGRVLTPLWVISLFVSLTEITLGAVTTQTTGGVQVDRRTPLQDLDFPLSRIWP